MSCCRSYSSSQNSLTHNTCRHSSHRALTSRMMLKSWACVLSNGGTIQSLSFHCGAESPCNSVHGAQTKQIELLSPEGSRTGPLPPVCLYIYIYIQLFRWHLHTSTTVRASGIGVYETSIIWGHIRTDTGLQKLALLVVLKCCPAETKTP